jgi:hypothetical protein
VSEQQASDFAALLAELEDRIRATGAGVVDLLAPGISEDQVRTELAEVGMDPPGELVTWFGWHNGLTTAHPKSYGDGLLLLWLPLTLAESIAEWRPQDHGFEPWQWNPTWLPIGLRGGPERLAVDCTPPQHEVATLRMADPFSGSFNLDDRPNVTGFATIVGWWIEAMDRHWRVYDPDRDLWDYPEYTRVPVERRITGLT